MARSNYQLKKRQKELAKKKKKAEKRQRKQAKRQLKSEDNINRPRKEAVTDDL